MIKKIDILSELRARGRFSHSERPFLSQRDAVSLTAKCRFSVLVLLMMVIGAHKVWGQETPDYSGTYFIANGNGYKSNDVANNFYLVPATNSNYATDQPHLTTSKTGQVLNCCWQIVKKEVEDKVYYHIIHVLDGKYLTANPEYDGTTGNDVGRLRVHLETIANPEENEDILFEITPNNAGGCNIRHKDMSDIIKNGNTTYTITYLDPAGGNREGTNLTDYRTMNTSSGKVNIGGGIGYWGDEPAARWRFERVPQNNTYTYNIVDNQGRIAIKYTTGADQPAAKALSSYLNLPEEIRSPYLKDETVKFYTFSNSYSTSEELLELLNAENKIAATPVNGGANIYVQYTTDHLLDRFYKLRGERAFNITLNGKCIYDNDGTLTAEEYSGPVNTKNYLWSFFGHDPYAVQIKNLGTGNLLQFDTSGSTLSVADNPTNKYFIIMDGSSTGAGIENGQIELMAASGDANYYRIKLDGSNFSISNATATGDASLQVRAYSVSTTVTYHLIDKVGKLIVSASNPSSNLELPDEWKSPLVSEYHYYKNAGLNDDTYSPTEQIYSPFEADNGNVYVTYDVNDDIDLTGGKSYLLIFSGGQYFNQENGSDGINETQTQAVYPYNNGDFNLYVYGQEQWNKQKGDGASTRTRWLWKFVSRHDGTDLTGDAIDPYHVVVKSHQNHTIKATKGSDTEYKFPGNSYLQTYKPSDYAGVITNIAYENKEYNQYYPDVMTSSMVNGQPTEYMILGTSLQNMTLKTFNEVENERRTVNSFEQYWKNNPTVANLSPVPTDWHQFTSWAYSAPVGNDNKRLKEEKHWYQTISMGTGEFAVEEVSLTPQVILLDQHGWEVLRVPMYTDNDFNEVNTEALRKYNSPMVYEYHWYPQADKVTGYHKFNISNPAPKIDIYENSANPNNNNNVEWHVVRSESYSSKSLAETPHEKLDGYAGQDKKYKTDFYVTYTVKANYANNYQGAATEDAVIPSAYLLKQNGNYATYSGSGTEIGTETQKPSRENIPNNMLWNLKPNFNIDREMGYKYAGETGAYDGAKTKAAAETEYLANGQNGFDPYNVQIQSKANTSRYFTADTEDPNLDGGVWKGTSNTITLQNLGTKQTATGNDQTTLNITNATFMVVEDASPSHNMRLMPRFDHGKVMQSFGTLAAQAAAGASTQTLLLDLLTNAKEIHSSSEITDMSGNYLLAEDFTFDANFTSLGTSSEDSFTGIIDGQLYEIAGPSVPLVAYAQNATIRNVIFKGINIGSGNTEGDAGAICCKAAGATRIYNCGILPTGISKTDPNDESKITGFSGSEVGGSRYVGGIVGFLADESRVINCYSYATIKGGNNSTVGGIVGYNNVASTQENVATMVMNCMFYGDITGGKYVSPVYGGENIDNKEPNGLATYNYYAYSQLKTKQISNGKYNCTLAMEERFINRCEIYRLLLNSNKKLAAIYVTGDAAAADQMAKWVLETADRSISGREPYPYPVLKAQGYYPSIINYDAKNAPSLILENDKPKEEDRNHGGKLGKTLSVTIATSKNQGKLDWPTDASITKNSLTLQRTDKDFDRFNFNYDKVQLPYYNEVGEGNYTDNKVVTGWIITAIDGGTAGTYSAADNFGGYNFADRNCTNKDLYSKSGRIFSQGAYFDVPYGVTGITIEPYWGVAAYVSDQYYDVVYSQVSQKNNNYTSQLVSGLGTQYDSNPDKTSFNGTQKVYTSIESARASMQIPSSGKTVYDYAVVLVGNVHQAGPLAGGTTPYTITSVDLDKDNEPDYSFIFSHYQRQTVSPIRFDFLNVIGTAQAQKPNGATQLLNVSVFKPKGWFEVTNTCSVHIVQFEGYNGESKASAPIILLGGVFDQFTSTQSQKVTTQTLYIHIGGNAWFKAFGNGTHSDGFSFTKHVPISVTGGDFEEFYLSGVYRPDAGIDKDDAECYISSGHFKEMAGAGQQMIDGDVHWQIYNADITNFYGGGINAAKPITGDVTVDIFNSHVDTYCGGPKFGDMQKAGTTFETTYSKDQKGTTTGTYSSDITKDGKVTTNATGCTFGKFFGAGYGGASSSKVKFFDSTTGLNFDNLMNNFTNDRGKYFDGNGSAETDKTNYGNKGPGVATDFDYEFFIWSSGLAGARFYVNYTIFSTAKTNDVESNLTNCIINKDFYGGGSLGMVDGNAKSVLEGCKVKGSVYGGGFSASIPSVPVRTTGYAVTPVINYNAGIFDLGKKNGTTDFLWKEGTFPDNNNLAIEDGKILTDVNLDNLGAVTGNVSLTINGSTTTVAKSIYGGGEESAVDGNTEVSVTGGTIGTADYGGAEYGNVYGGGKGKEKNVTAGLVKGNTTVSISGSPTIIHNVYGGGAYGSVGDFNYDTTTGMPTSLKTENTGTTKVNITGGTIGTTGQENGMVFGSSRGDVAVPEGNPAIDPNDRMAWVYKTEVVIGQTNDQTAGPQIKGSVYGSGENGHTLNDTDVKVHSGTIGIESGEEVTYQGIKYSGPRYLFRGNVYGGGCGTDTYEETDAQEITKTYYNFNAGIVKGNTKVTIDGGHIVHNVYGGGAMGSVGTYTSFIDDAYNTAHPDAKLPVGKPKECAENTGKCTVEISGGVIGVAGAKMTAGGGPDDYGHVFGAGRGDAKDPEEYPNVEISGYYNQTDVTISGSALVTGSVYGGSESGHVLNDTKVTIAGGQIGCGEGKTAAYTQEEWTAESSETLKPTSHWTYVDDGAPYDQYADENGNYANNVSSEGGNRKATDGHTFYGNVFAGGSGYYPYAQGKWLFSAGCVEGSATLEITGGHILNNVYGGCEMSDVLGAVSVKMSGGTVGVPRNKQDILLNPTIGHIFGGGMGDKRIFFNTVTNVASSTVSVSGGRVYGSVHGGGEDGHVLGLAKTTISGTVKIGSVKDGSTSGFDGNVFGGGQGSPTALTAGTVGGNVELDILGGEMYGSVYGGGRIASVGTYFALTTMEDPNNPGHYIPNPNYGKMQGGPDHGFITVNLKGGTIHQSVYGGCMGTKGMAAVDQVRFAVSKNVTVELNKDVADNAKGCIVKGNIFGCNNVNSSPQEDVTVHIYATQNANATRIANPAEGEQTAKVKARYDVNAVYGGGNMAAYLPKGPNATDDNYDGKNTTYSTHVIIDGCDRTSIKQVYGGGNAATTPATEVTVNGTYEIDELFGGGNGKDRITYDEGSTWLDNPGANVGFYDYSAEESTYDTKEKRTQGKSGTTFVSKYVYGTGVAAVNVFGGLINYVFGGSNTKGNVRETAITLLEEKQGTEDCCPFNVGEVYGGGKSAPMDADAKIYMACIPGLKAAYGGAEAADIQGGVTLNITNGTFDRVFGGNNISGTIRGPIEVNIEEIGCRPIIIGELYGGGNLAPYSVYGYNDNGTIIESGTTKAYKDPVVNVKSFTSIGSVYGGGYGSTAVMVGDPTVNINVALGSKASESSAEIGKEGTDWKDMAVKDGQLVDKTVEGSYPIPYHKKDAIGAITNVFGGGNAAEVIGKTSVNIGTRVGEDEYMAVVIKEGETLPTLPEGEKYYTRTGTAPNYTYTETNHTKAQEGVTYYKKYVIKGVDIRGNVYGGGNNADVTGDTNVIIGKEKPAP